MTELSNKLQKLLNDRGITPAELSRTSGVSQARISEIVSGKTQNPQLKTLEKLSKVLDTDLSFEIFISHGNHDYISTPDHAYAPGLLSQEDQDLLSKFRRLDDKHRGNILEIMAGYEALNRVKQ